ncbi:HDOD domain-containing protein [Pseudoduganella sp. GCM10020061]|uniref:HDOD domain-containing protein n=1 Tax=Pseudoduganella sp. GCM10020061 TaxID=3317345 RepID=UPI00362B32EC
MLPEYPPKASADTRRVRAALLKKVCGDDEMFALGSSIARVVQMASSDDQGTQELAYYVLSDVALTQRILRLSNTAQYRRRSGTPVTTVSRAISLLGFDNVKTTALAMLLVDALSNSAHANSVRVELEAALCASLVGREMARFSTYQGAEEASIGALFKNLGPLLVATHEHERYREINLIVADGKHTPNQAAQMILGCSYDALSEAVLAEWQIPDPIVRALVSPAAGPLKPALNRGEWMRQVAAFSHDVARLLGKSANPAASNEAREMLVRYGAALSLRAEPLAELFETVQDEMNAMLQSMNMERKPRVVEEPDDPGSLPDFLQLATMESAPQRNPGTHPSGKPMNAHELLLACVQDVTQLRAGGQCTANDVILAVLDGLYRSLGFRFATVVMKDARNMQYRARVSFGERHAQVQAEFVFPVQSARDIFHLSMENDADLTISDAFTQKMRELLPAWYRKLRPEARSFVVLPLVVNGMRAGLFYADRDTTAPEGITPDEAALIKALKSQVIAALSP